jgi:predicted Zn-ribbon and HTH transcriptional regulator
MKNIVSIPLPKEEDIAALKKRRDNYAISRDLQASEFNEAIAKRLLSQARSPVKCEKCGKEFIAGAVLTESATCPECK